MKGFGKSGKMPPLRLHVSPRCLAGLGVTVRDLGDPPVFVGAAPGVRNFASVLGRFCLTSASCCGILFCFFHAVKKLLAIRTRAAFLVSHRKLGGPAPWMRRLSVRCAGTLSCWVLGSCKRHAGATAMCPVCMSRDHV